MDKNIFRVNTMGGAMNFAQYCFNYLNGKVNCMIPAHSLAFGHDLMHPRTYGDTTVDIVEINLPNLFREYRGEYDEASIRGDIFYVILHELLHLDQDMEWYFSTFEPYGGKSEAVQMIEQACHAKTLMTCEELAEFVLMNDIKLFNGCFYVPTYDSFTDLVDNPEIIKQNALSFYRIRNPLDKALWFVNKIFLTSNIQDDIVNIDERIDYVILEVNINGKNVVYDYIYYMNNWVQFSRIFDMIRPAIWLLKKWEGYIDKTTTFSTLIEYEHMAKITAELSGMPSQLDIVHRIPANDMPVLF